MTVDTARHGPHLCAGVCAGLAAAAVLCPTAGSARGQTAAVPLEGNERACEISVGLLELRLGGRLVLDAATFFPDRELEETTGPLEDDVEIRRGRLNVRAKVGDHIKLKVAYDFAAEELKSVYLELSEISDSPFRRVRVGRTKEPFSLEKLTSSNYLTFMERSLANASEPGFSWGILVGGTALDDGIAWAAGLFLNDDDFGDAAAEDRFNLTGRASTVLASSSDDRRLVHLGGAFSLRNPMRRALRLRQRPEAHLAPRLVDTGVFPADHALLLGVEAAVVRGPISAQAEVIRADFDSPAGADPSEALALYVEGSYFLTGEHRLYRRSTGTFTGPVNPRNRLGAFQVGLRYSMIDLDAAALAGGRLDDWTLGLNWYWNRYSRLMLNYVDTRRRDGGTAGILQLRLQANF